MKGRSKVENLGDLVALFGQIKKYNWDEPLSIEYKPWEDERGLSQNALSHVWYRQCQKHRGDVELFEAAGELKLDFAVPILLAENKEYEDLFKYCLLPYTREERVEILGKGFCPSTSLLTVKQFTDYLSSVQNHCSKNGIHLLEQGEYDELMMKRYI